MAIHQRVAMTLETIKMLQHQTYPIEIVLVGDSKIEQNIAKQTGCRYVQHANRPLGAKHQAGIDYARLLSPDVLMTTGSDSWVSLDWVERMLPYLSVYDCVGQNRWYVLNLQEDSMRIVGPGHGLCQYQGKRAGDPLGVGRLITHEGLEMMNWQVYPVQNNRNLDGNVYRQMLYAGLSIGVVNEVPVKILGIKGPWEVLSRWVERQDNHYFPEPEQWLDKYFLGGLEALNRVRAACWADEMGKQ